MHVFETVVLALVLSIDAFAVSVVAAASGRLQDHRAVFRLSFHFGLFQFLMPILGWTAGSTLEPLIAPVDHWIGAAILTGVAIRMLRAGQSMNTRSPNDDPSRGVMLLALSTATSIDALAVGLSLAFLETGIWGASILIGVVAGLCSLLGILLGGRVQAGIGRWAEVIGGIILLCIAARMLVAHLGQ